MISRKRVAYLDFSVTVQIPLQETLRWGYVNCYIFSKDLFPYSPILRKVSWKIGGNE
jgi:hypothetical protein